jgi:hypothetical protein
MYSNGQIVVYPSSRLTETVTTSIRDFAFILYKDKLIGIQVNSFNVIYFKTNKTIPVPIIETNSPPKASIIIEIISEMKIINAAKAKTPTITNGRYSNHFAIKFII